MNDAIFGESLIRLVLKAGLDVKTITVICCFIDATVNSYSEEVWGRWVQVFFFKVNYASMKYEVCLGMSDVYCHSVQYACDHLEGGTVYII